MIYERCDICGKPDETVRYPWGDQMYYFCPQHSKLVRSIINETNIPIGFVVEKLTGKPLNSYLEKQFVERGYATLWRDEWKEQV